MRCMTSVWRVAGRTASRQSGKRSSISAAWSRRTKSRSPITRNVGAVIDADLVGGPAGEVVDDRLQALEEREEVGRVRRHRLVVGLPGGELLLGRQARVVLLGRRDLGVVAVGADVRGGEHEAADLGRVADGEARGGEGAEAEAPHVDGSAARDPVDQLGDVVGEALDRHRAGRCRACGRGPGARPRSPGGPRVEPREDVAEAAVEREDAAVEGDERRAVGVAVLLVPDGDAVDLFVGHAPRR